MVPIFTSDTKVLVAVLIPDRSLGCSVSQEVVRRGLLTEHEATVRKLRQEAEDQLLRAERERSCRMN